MYAGARQQQMMGSHFPPTAYGPGAPGGFAPPHGFAPPQHGFGGHPMGHPGGYGGHPMGPYGHMPNQSVETNKMGSPYRMADVMGGYHPGHKTPHQSMEMTLADEKACRKAFEDKLADEKKEYDAMIAARDQAAKEGGYDWDPAYMTQKEDERARRQAYDDELNKERRRYATKIKEWERISIEPHELERKEKDLADQHVQFQWTGFRGYPQQQAMFRRENIKYQEDNLWKERTAIEKEMWSAVHGGGGEHHQQIPGMGPANPYGNENRHGSRHRADHQGM